MPSLRQSRRRFALPIRGITDALPMSLVLPRANRKIGVHVTES